MGDGIIERLAEEKIESITEVRRHGEKQSSHVQILTDACRLLIIAAANFFNTLAHTIAV
jgi:hypothetical protein